MTIRQISARIILWLTALSVIVGMIVTYPGGFLVGFIITFGIIAAIALIVWACLNI